MAEMSREERTPLIEQGEAFCERCGLHIRPGSEWRWGVQDGLDVVEHLDCALVADDRPLPPEPPTSPGSRDW